MAENLQDFIRISKDIVRSEEGFTPRVFQETAGRQAVPTVGRGFNMKEPHVRNVVRNVAPHVLQGQPMSVEEADRVFDGLYGLASRDAEQFVGSDIYSALPDAVKATVIDNAYQLGLPRLQGFKRYRQALRDGDFDTAANELLDSRYARQVPKRAKRAAERIRNHMRGI